MKHGILILAIVLIAFGIVGLIATRVYESTLSYGSTGLPRDTYGMMGHAMNSGMMDGGMMQGMMEKGMPGNGMMGMHGANDAPYVNATPVPANRPIDRVVSISARNSQFDPARIVVKQGETVRFAITNQDSYAHIFGSTDARIPFILLPANGMASTAWVPAQKGTFNILCTFHPGMTPLKKGYLTLSF